VGIERCLQTLTKADGTFRRRKPPNPPISLPKLRTCRVLGPKGRISDAMTQAAADRYAWAEPGVEDLGGGVHRIPLPLPIVGLRAVNVYAIAEPGGVDLIDAGIALGPAREGLTAGLRQLGYELGDVRNFFVTHVHIDHYSLAIELRKTFHSVVFLGEEERANLTAIRELVNGNRNRFFGTDSLRRLGALELLNELAGHERQVPAVVDWEDPDRWVADGTDLDAGTRTLRAVHTPGHTRGHIVFHDAAAQIMFAGDHVLPHITPSIGFEPADNRLALLDYLSSLARTLALPDARLLPAHGPVAASTHERVNELLAHHDQRLAETLQAVQAGNATAYAVAKAIKWTRRLWPFADLDLFAQVQAVNETAAHLEVLAVRGQLAHEMSAEGADIYQLAPPGTSQP
jgi:glyoxylase-like metal-dependent hydrolase (beta-lactamase superfamily II)